MSYLFFYIYTLLAFGMYLLSIPFLIAFSFKDKYKDSISHRFFRFRNPPLEPNGIWFHTCSYGESLAIEPIIERLPSSLLRFTTITQTGYSVISKYSKQSRYLPFEILLFGWVKPQKALIVVEAELWYLLFILTKRKGTKTILINARMSDKSFSSYLKFAWFYRYIFAHIDKIYAQSEIDKERLELLGAKNIIVTGNIKLANLVKPTKILEKPTGLLVCAASTHEHEESLILDAFAKLKEKESKARLLIVPRHPERFDKVSLLTDKFASENTLSWHRYSKRQGLDSDIVVVDTLGELVNLYAISDIVILGGAFEPIGGHNGAEAAQFGCKIISGEHYFNQKDIFKAISDITIATKDELSDVLLSHGELKPSMLKYKVNINMIIESIKDVL